MEYLKFNCYDLAAQNTELFRIHRQMQSLSDELAGILNMLERQINNYESLKNVMAASESAIADIAVSIFNQHNALDQIVDIYYAAENKVTELVEKLPTGIAVSSSSGRLSERDFITSKMSAAAISNNDLVLEDWLLELIYKQGDSENKG